MESYSAKNHQKLIREIALILIIKVIILMMIKSIWFDAPTIPKGMDQQVAEHIAGTPPASQESSR